MYLKSLTAPGLVFTGLAGDDVASVLDTWAGKLAATGEIGDAETLRDRLLEREALGSTGVGGGVAIPHCKLAALESVVVSVGTTARPIPWGAIDEVPVRLLFLVASPAAKPAAHLQTLAAIARWLKQDRHAERLIGARDPEAVWALLADE